MLVLGALLGTAAPAQGQQVRITIQNRGKSNIQVYEVRFQGREAFLATLKPGDNGGLDTTVGDQFVVRDALTRQVLRRFTALQAQTIQIGNAAGPGQPQNGAPANVTIRNGSNAEVSLFWVNPQGREIPYGKIKPNVEGGTQTRIGDTWVIRSATGQQLQRVRITQLKQAIVVQGAAPLPPNRSTELFITNSTPARIQVYWLSFQGKEISYGFVNPNDSMKRITGLKQTWVIRDAQTQKELQRIRVTQQTQRVTVQAAAPPPQAFVLVPNLLNHSRNAAEGKLRGVGLVPKAVEGIEVKPGGQVGGIYSQLPAPGNQAKRGTQVTFFYYKAKPAAPAGRLTISVDNQTPSQVLGYFFNGRNQWQQFATLPAKKKTPLTVFVTNRLQFRDATNNRVLNNVTIVNNHPPIVLSAPVVATATVPNLQNLTKAAAETALRNSGLKPKGSEGNTTTNANLVGKVHSQSINALTKVAPGTEVAFQYFKAQPVAPNGRLTVTIDNQTPNQVFGYFFNGQNQWQQFANLPAKQKTPITVFVNNRIQFRDANNGKALKTHTIVNNQPTIVLAAPAVVATVTVPNLQNLTNAAAETALRNSGLKPNGSPGNPTANVNLVGKVYTQSVNALVKVAPGTEITFQFYKAAQPPPVTTVRVPNLTNLFKLDAEIALQQLGLKAQGNAVPTNSPMGKVGIVYNQTTSAGSTVRPGTTVQFSYHIPSQAVAGATIEVPWVVNKNRWHAEARLLSHGLIPKANDGAATNDAGLYDRAFKQNPEGTHPGKDGKSMQPYGSVVTYTYFKSNGKMGPFDANSPDRIPNLIAYANANDSIDIAWMRRDRKVIISSYGGNNWSQAVHLPVDNALSMLEGFTRDDRGNMYLTTMRKEFAPKWRWDVGYTPNVAHILKIPAGTRTVQLLADINKQNYSRQPIVNPSLTQSAFRNTSRLVFGNNMLAMVFAQNHGAWNNVHETSNLVAVGVDASPRYSRGAGQHCMGLRLMYDGKEKCFVMAQAFEEGIGLSKLKQNGISWTWTNHRLIFSNPLQNGNFLSIAGIARTNTGYLVVCAHGAGRLNNSNNVEWNGIGRGLPLFTVTVPSNFDSEPAFDRKGGRRGVIKSANQRLLIKPATNDSVFVRPKIVDLKNGKYIVICEQRGYSRFDGYQNTQAVVIDGNGNIVRGPKTFNNAPTQRSNDAVFLPQSRKAAWVSGDAANGRIMLYTLDESLNLRTYPLSIPQ